MAKSKTLYKIRNILSQFRIIFSKSHLNRWSIGPPFSRQTARTRFFHDAMAFRISPCGIRSQLLLSSTEYHVEQARNPIQLNEILASCMSQDIQTQTAHRRHLLVTRRHLIDMCQCVRSPCTCICQKRILRILESVLLFAINQKVG